MLKMKVKWGKKRTSILSNGCSSKDGRFNDFEFSEIADENLLDCWWGTVAVRLSGIVVFPCINLGFFIGVRIFVREPLTIFSAGLLEACFPTFTERVTPIEELRAKGSKKSSKLQRLKHKIRIRTPFLPENAEAEFRSFSRTSHNLSFLFSIGKCTIPRASVLIRIVLILQTFLCEWVKYWW